LDHQSFFRATEAKSFPSSTICVQRESARALASSLERGNNGRVRTWMPPCRATRTWEASSGAACSCHRLRILGRCHGITSDGESRNLRNRHPVLSVKTSVVGRVKLPC
jgi:hypothetical protein